MTGSQRSGTTLLSLILDSHPEIKTIDEVLFARQKLNDYLSSPDFPPHVVFKLPRYATEIEWIRALPEPRILWCLRDPRDVVASMLQLTIPVTTVVSCAWAVHPNGGMDQVASARSLLDDAQRAALQVELDRFDVVAAKPLTEITFPDAILCAALCWTLKNELLRRFDEAGLAYRIVAYEEVVSNPTSSIAAILDYLEVEWHDDVLRHHELHSGIYIADVDFSRPIDRASVGRWKNRFHEAQAGVIERVARPLAERLGCWTN